jgi:anti-sigma B factor antagonist
MGRGKLERLLNVRLFQVGIIGEQFDAFGVGAKDFEHSPDRNPQTANAGLAPHFARFDGNPIKGRLQSHDLYSIEICSMPGMVCEAGSELMSSSLKVIMKGDVSLVQISGRLTMSDGAQTLRTIFRDLIDAGKKKIILDLADVPYIDSSGVGVLFSGYMELVKAGGTVKVAGLQGPVRSILQITKLYTVFDTYDDAEAALQAFGE